MKTYTGVNQRSNSGVLKFGVYFLAASALVAMKMPAYSYVDQNVSEAEVEATVITASIGGETAPIASPAMPEAVTSIEHFRVHRSAIRDDKIAITVVKGEANEQDTIELPGLEGVSFNKICRSAEGTKSSCGSRARVQLVNFVALKEISCKFVARGKERALVSCEIGGQDLGEWLVRTGIARPLESGVYMAATLEAREAQRGMWADAETRIEVKLAANK